MADVVQVVGKQANGGNDPSLSFRPKRESKSKPDQGIVRNQIRLSNQKGELVLQCIANVLVARRSESAETT